MVLSKDFIENSYINQFLILLKYALQRYQALKKITKGFLFLKNFCNSLTKNLKKKSDFAFISKMMKMEFFPFFEKEKRNKNQALGLSIKEV